MPPQPNTVWAVLGGVTGSAGGVLFIDNTGLAPTLDTGNLFFDNALKALYLGFATNGSLTRYNAAGPEKLTVEYGINSYLAQSKQTASDYASFSASSSRGTAQIPLVNLDADLLGKLSFKSYSTLLAAAAPAFNEHATIEAYASGVTAANLGGQLEFRTKADNGALTTAMLITNSQAITMAGNLTIGGNLIVVGTFTSPAIVVNTGNITDQAVTAFKESDDEVNLISASTTDIGAVNSRVVNVTGAVTINSFGVAPLGRLRLVKFAAALTLTHNATSMQNISGRNILTAAGDSCLMESLGLGNWKMLSYNTVSGLDLSFSIIPQNSRSADYTLDASDAGKCIYHPVGDANARAFTIPANGSVPYPIGTVIQFANRSPNACTIAITSDVLTWCPTGSTGTRTLAQFGVATAEKVTATEWLLTGVGLS
jgi:hypothetical protein